MSDHHRPGAGMTGVAEQTREAEQQEAVMPADPDGEPTPEEEAAADANEVDPTVSQANDNTAALQRRANLAGTGRIG